MKYIVFIISLLIVFCFIFSHNAKAQETDKELEFLLDLDIEDLTVVVASKKAEKFADAPSVINVVTAEEIKSYGATDILDVLNRVTSIQTFGSNFLPDNVVSIRGQSLTHNDNHILVLINGRPFRDGISGGFNFPLYKSIPIGMVERIEIIRGPGSVLYGTNAFSGVVDIITKKPSKEKEGYAAATYGSLKTRGFESAGGLKEENWNIMTGFKYMNTDGWQLTATDESGILDNYNRDDKNVGFVFTGEYKGLTLNTVYVNSIQANLGGRLAFPSDTIRVKKIFSDIGYSHKILKNWEAQYNVTANILDELNQSEAGDPGFSNDVRFEPLIRGPLFSKKLNLLFGGSYEIHDGQLNGGGKFVDTEWFSAYSQASYQLFQPFTLIAGVQWNKPSGVDGDFSPRLSALYKINNEWGVKLLYGEAFRTAYASERALDLGFLIGNPSLNPETIQTTEAQVYYNSKGNFAALTFFHSEMKEIVNRQIVSPGVFQFVNSGEIDFYGFELEGKARITNQWSLNGNLTWQENEEEDTGVKNSTFSPNWMGKLGVSYKPNAKYQMSLFDSYFGNPTQVSEINQSVSDANPKPEDYHLVTANAIFNLNALLNLKTSSGFKFSLFIDNLLDEDINFPEFNRRNVNSLPIYSGRAAYGQLEIQF